MEIHAMRREVGLNFLDIDKALGIYSWRQRLDGCLGLNVLAFLPGILGMTTGTREIPRLPSAPDQVKLTPVLGREWLVRDRAPTLFLFGLGLGLFGIRRKEFAHDFVLLRRNIALCVKRKCDEAGQRQQNVRFFHLGSCFDGLRCSAMLPFDTTEAVCLLIAINKSGDSEGSRQPCRHKGQNLQQGAYQKILSWLFIPF
jgi:hypothetical protein